MAYCERCGKEIRPGADACEACGSPVPGLASGQNSVQTAEQDTHGGAPQGQYAPSGQYGFGGAYGSREPVRQSRVAWLVIATVIALVLCLVGGGMVALYKLGLFQMLTGKGGTTPLRLPLEKASEDGIEDNAWEADGFDTGEDWTDVQFTWAGYWYGYFHVTHADGEYADMLGETYDCYADVYVDKDDTGELYLYVGGETEDDMVAWADFDAEEFVLKVSQGQFWDMDLNPEDWTIHSDGLSFTASSTYVDPERTEGDSFSYTLYVKPYGFLWEDEELLPPGYDTYVEDLED